MCIIIDFGPPVVWLSAFWIAFWGFLAGVLVGEIRERRVAQDKIERCIFQMTNPPWIALPPAEPVLRIDPGIANTDRYVEGEAA